MNDKLYNAFIEDDYIKIDKYLSKGADPTIYDNKLYKYAAANDDIDLLIILFKYNKCIKDKGIVSIACSFNSQKCIKYMLSYINIEDYKRTAIYSILQGYI